MDDRSRHVESHRDDGLRLTRGLAWAGALGPLWYITLATVLGLAWEGYDPIRDTQSELGAVDAPAPMIMNLAGFMVLGWAILAFAGAYARVLRPGWATWAASGLLVVAGVGMVVVGFLPCDAGCVDVTTTGRLHGLLSAPGAIGLPAAAMLSAGVFRADGRFSASWQFVSFWLGLFALATGPVVMAGWIEDAGGVLQRLGMWPPLLWMSAVSLRFLRFTRPSSSRRPAGPEVPHQ